MNSTYSITVKAGVTSIISIPTYITEGTTLVTSLFDGTTLPTTVHDGKIQITVASSLATPANDGMRFWLRQNGKELTRGNIYVRSDTPSPGSGGGDYSGPVDWADVQNKPFAFTPSYHQHNVNDLNNASATAKTFLTASDPASARAVLGAGTSNLVIGTGSGNAKAGNYVPAWSEVTSKPSTFPAAAHAHVINDISNATDVGRSVLAASTAADVRALLGISDQGGGSAGPTAWGDITGKPTTFAPIIGSTATTAKAGNYVPDWTEVTNKPSTFAPTAHQHASTDISDATATGRSIVTAASGSAVRALIGAGTSDLVVGTGSGDAKAGNYVPDWSDITNKPGTFAPSAHAHVVNDLSNATAIGKSVLTAADAAAARTAIGAGTGSSNLTLGTTSTTAKAGDYVPAWTDVTGKPSTFSPSAHSHPSTDISDASTVGKSVLTAANAAAARTAIGAGTSNLAVGTTSSDAKAGDYVPAWSDITSKPTTFAPTAHTHTATEISNSTTVGRSLITAADAGSARTAIGAGTSNLALGTTASTAKAGNYVPAWGEITGVPSTFAPTAHTHASADITDSTTVGRAVLVAADAGAARGAIGAGTSSLTLGTTNTTAKAGDYVPAWGEITSKPSTFAPSAHTHVAADISNSTLVGRNVLTATDAAAARTAIGAGTSNLAVGTASTDAKAGNYVPDWTDVTNKPTTFPPAAHTHTGVYEPVITAGTTSQVWRGDKTWITLDKTAVGLSNVDNTSDVNKPVSTAQQAALDAKANLSHTHGLADMPGTLAGYVRYNGSSWPTRPTARTDMMYIWIGPETPAPPKVASGTGGMIDNLDVRLVVS